MKKNNKGFTLIELLVVVAIIGILAAVGVVAYSGYTKGAKKSAVKSNQAAVIKYIAAELKKCEIGETDVMVKGSSKLVCSTRKSGTNVSTAVNGALGTEFKNPYRTSESAITTSSISCNNTVVFSKDARNKKQEVEEDTHSITFESIRTKSS